MNGVNKAAEPHSTEEEILVWAAYGLRSLDELNDEELQNAKRLFDARYERAKSKRERRH